MKVSQLCPTLCNPMDDTVHGVLQARILEWVAFPYSRGSSQSRIKPRSPTLQVGSLPAEPQGKPKILEFLTWELNWGLLHWSRILYQLSHHGSPRILSEEPVPSPGDFPHPGTELGSAALQADSLPTEPQGSKR